MVEGASGPVKPAPGGGPEHDSGIREGAGAPADCTRRARQPEARDPRRGRRPGARIYGQASSPLSPATSTRRNWSTSATLGQRRSSSPTAGRRPTGCRQSLRRTGCRQHGGSVRLGPLAGRLRHRRAGWANLAANVPDCRPPASARVLARCRERGWHFDREVASADRLTWLAAPRRNPFADPAATVSLRSRLRERLAGDAGWLSGVRTSTRFPSCLHDVGCNALDEKFWIG